MFSLGLRFPANLSASVVIDSLNEWDGVEDTVTLFQNLALSESGTMPNFHTLSAS